MKNFFLRLRARHYAWAGVLAIVGLWWPSFILTTPPEFIRSTVDVIVLNLCMVITMIGSFTKIAGFFGSQQPGKVGVLGISVELVGLILAVVGPFAYLATSFAASLNSWGERNFFNSAVIFCVAVFFIYVYRAIIIVPRFFKEAHDDSKE